MVPFRLVSPWTVTTAVILYNLALVLVWLLRRSRRFPARYGVGVMLFITVLGVVRLFTPMDNSAAKIIGSDTVIPAIVTFLQKMPFEGAEICIWHILLAVWGLGSAVYLLRIALSVRRDLVTRASFVPEKNDLVESAAAALGTSFAVIVSRQVPTPHVAGVFRPRIYVPPLELDEQQWQHVLRHELQHIRSRDLLLKFLYFFLAAVFWWNPLSHVFVGELDALLELRCDSKVTGKMDEQGKKEYLGTMLSVVRQSMQGEWNRAELHAGFMSPLANAKQRFENVLEFDAAKYRSARSIVSLAILLVFALSYFVVIQPYFLPPAEDIENVETVTAETSFILHSSDGEYKMYVNGELWDILTEEQLQEMPYSELPIYEGS